MKSKNANPDWEAKSLDQLINEGLITLGRGKVISKKDLAATPGSYPVYSSAKEKEGRFGEYGKYMFDEELITWSVDGGGRLFHRRKHKFSVTNVGGTLRINDTSTLDYRFLFYCLSLLHSRISFDWVKKAHPSIIRKLYTQIPLPPFPEQKRIVGILDQAFAAISTAKANAEKNLQNAREFFESYLQGVFANPGDEWEEKKLGTIAKVIGGFSFKSTDFKKQGRYQVIRMGNVRPGIIRPNERPVFIDDIDDTVLKRALLLPNDVIITQTGTKKKRDYGFTVIIDKKNYLLNQRIAAIRFSSNFLPKFFLYFSWTIFFKDQYFANETGTVGQGNVGISAITDARVPFPPLAQQKAIVAKLDELSAETKKLESIYRQKLADLEELKKSILQKAFNGELAGAKA